MIQINNEHNDKFLNNEWLVTNGLGGYASSTLSGALTRRYHGLLIASINPPTQRRILVSKTEEILNTEKDSFELSTNYFGNTISPLGVKHIKSFERDPLPNTIFEGPNFKLSKIVFMPYVQNTTVVIYKNLGTENFKLKSKLIFNHRDYHSNLFENTQTDFYTLTKKDKLTTYAYYGAMPLYTYHNGAFQSNPSWYKNYFYPKEAERGLQANEDLFCIGEVDFNIKPGDTAHLVFTIEDKSQKPLPIKLKEAEILRLKKFEKNGNKFYSDLKKSADQFLVKRKATKSYTVIAGYHWFTDWGRDSMIALRGLAIDTDRPQVVESIVNTFLQHLNQGMLPNRFPDSPKDEIEYNTIDATLWLFIVLHEYYEKFQSKKLIINAFEALTSIIEHYKKGTRYDIHETPEGFIYGGKGIAQLTWMDARIGDYVVTPRHGCPVEIQALWYNALKIYCQFGKLLKIKNDTINSAKDSLTRFKKNFRKEFWNANNYLNDVVLPWHSVDKSIRCNQIYAVSLPYSPLNKKDQNNIVKIIEKELLTPFGLRTLDHNNKDFCPVYSGDIWNRDGAYHQGTVWPFLLSEYVEAKLKVSKQKKEDITKLKALLEPLKNHFYNENCLYAISEIFDGSKPDKGKGTVQQAWSIAALIRILKCIKENKN